MLKQLMVSEKHHKIVASYKKKKNVGTLQASAEHLIELGARYEADMKKRLSKAEQEFQNLKRK